MAIADGIYELRTLLNTGMAADIAGGSATRGANLQIYAANGTNAQKFRIVEEEAGKWSLECIASGMYIDVAAGAAASRTNVQQYTDNDSRAQRWNIVETGATADVEGVACPVVTLGSYVTDDGAAYRMDVRGGMTTNSANIWIYAANDTDAQRWALYPTSILDRSIPAPSVLGWAESVGGEPQSAQPAASALYPAWAFAEALLPLTGRGFEYRWRSRAAGASAGAWGAWSAWADAAVQTDGNRAWLASGIPADVPSGARALECELQLRTWTQPSGSDRSHGTAVSAVLKAAAVPTVAVTGLQAAPEGIRAVWTMAGYDGSATVNVESIVQGGRELIAAPFGASGTGWSGGGEIRIPHSALAAPLETGADATVKWSASTDQLARAVASGAAVLEPSYAPGRAGDLAVDAAPAPGRIIEADAGSGVCEAWIVHPGGMVAAIGLGSGLFACPYPFGEDFELYVTSRNAAATEWRSARLAYSAGFDGAKPVHAFNWAGGALLIEYDADDPLATEISIKADADETAYNGREWGSFRYGTAKDGTFTAKGVLIEGSASSIADVYALLEQGHAIYRAPSGEIFDAAVASASYTVRPDGIAAVTVQGAREAV